MVLISSQTAVHSISKLGISTAGLEQGQRLTTNQRTGTIHSIGGWEHLACRVNGG